MFHVSFSVLYPWNQGQWDEAVNRYLKVETPTTPAMEEGKTLHKSWESETKVTGCLPLVFGGQKLSNPVTEKRLEVYLDNWIELVGHPDLIDDDCIHEYKTGSADAVYWSRTPQILVYQMMCELSGFSPKKAVIHHYNQRTQVVSTAHRWLTPQSRAFAYEWVVSNASEMFDALLKAGIVDEELHVQK